MPLPCGQYMAILLDQDIWACPLTPQNATQRIFFAKGYSTLYPLKGNCLPQKIEELAESP